MLKCDLASDADFLVEVFRYAGTAGRAKGRRTGICLDEQIANMAMIAANELYDIVSAGTVVGIW